MEQKVLRRGDIMQISPDIRSNPLFAGSLMTVTEARTWGAVGYVQVLTHPPGRAYFRCEFADMEPTGGQAHWIEELDGDGWEVNARQDHD